MMEVVGAVAATAQLVATAVRIIQAILQLCEYLKHASGQFQSWQNELLALKATILSIRETPKLCNATVELLMAGIAVKTEELTRLCAQRWPVPNGRSLKKLVIALRSKTAESRILQIFAAIERDKTTLILTIGAMSHQVTGERFGQRIKAICANGLSHEFATKQAIVRQEQLFQELCLRQHDGIYHGPKYTCQQVAQKPYPAQMPSAEPSQPPRENRGGQTSTWIGITLQGDGSSFSDTSAKGAYFKDVKISGNRRIDGNHAPNVITTWGAQLAAGRPVSVAQNNPTHGHSMPMDGVDSHTASGDDADSGYCGEPMDVDPMDVDPK